MLKTKFTLNAKGFPCEVIYTHEWSRLAGSLALENDNCCHPEALMARLAQIFVGECKESEDIWETSQKDYKDLFEENP